MDKFISRIAKLVLLITLFSLALIFSPDNVSASRGTIDMRSTNNEDYRCYASSLVMQNNRYDVAINCVNVTFPINPPDISTYVVWADPINGKGPLRLGDLQKGVVRFEVQQPFTRLYITEEANANVRAPSADVVMSGQVESIDFLERETSPTPTTEVSEAEEVEEGEEDTSQLSTREKLMLALRRAGIAAIIALIAIVGLVFVVTRSRG